ncbi:hypothetical protein ACWDRR_01340 [Kitasatospora sp. NPDC003701]
MAVGGRGGRLPICDPHVLAIVFDGRRPVRVQDLGEAAPLGAAAGAAPGHDTDGERGTTGARGRR